MEPQTLALIALVLALLAAVMAGLALAAQQRTAQRYRVLWGEGGEGKPRDATAVLAGIRTSLGRQASAIEDVETRVERLRGDVGQALRHVAVVRYDAFGDMGGRLSFSAAIIDDQGDGVVISSIHARSDSRTYAKGVVGGASDVTLTPEEQQALAAAKASE